MIDVLILVPTPHTASNNEAILHRFKRIWVLMAPDVDGRTVLVIDDDRVLADTLSEILRKNGFTPVALYSGEEALELAERLRPEIVLSDIRMSRIDGVEAAKRIRALHPDCRVILFTAHVVSPSMRRMIEGMGFELLQRPLHPEHVLSVLRRHPDATGI
jgi:DNA-binding NtrC family response regulator